MGPIYFAFLAISFASCFIASHCQVLPDSGGSGERTLKSELSISPEIFELNPSSKSGIHSVNGSTSLAPVAAYVGSEVILDCQAPPLKQDQTVSWIQRKGDMAKRITSGDQVVIDDSRFSLEVNEDNKWRLRVRSVQWSDRGIYECETSTPTRRVLSVHLDLLTPFVEIIDSKGLKIKDGRVALRTGAVLGLICVVKHAHTFVIWTHNNRILNYDKSSPKRVSIKTDMSSSVGMSTLRVRNVSTDDTGNYTCSLGSVISSSVAVEVFKERINDSSLEMKEEEYAVEIPDYLNDSPQRDEDGASSSVWSYSTLSENRRSSHGGRSDTHELTPYFKDFVNSTNITAQLGSTAYLDCKINRLRDKTVSWMRRDGDAIKLLTFGLNTYSNDERYSLNFEHPNNWKLQIKYTQRRDQGTYECQISTHPPKVLLVNLNIVAPVVEIIDERGTNVQEKFYKTGSTIELRCTISQMPQAQTFILWRHGDHMLNYDTSRGGISVKTDMSSSVIVSTLFIANATPVDSGNYTCSLGDVASGSVLVHVLNGEHPAAMQLGCGNNDLFSIYLLSLPLLTAICQQVLYVR